MPRKVGIELVAEGEAQYSQSAKQAAESTALLTSEIFKLVEAQSKTIQGAEYQEFWKQAIEGTRAEYEEFWLNVGEMEKQATIETAQQAQEYEQFWIDALKSREQAEQEALIKSAQAASEYVRFWEEALAKQDALKNRQAATFGIAGGGPSIFDDPEKAAAMQANNARIAAEALAEAQNIVTTSANKGATAAEMYAESLLAQGMTAEQVAKEMKALGLSTESLGETQMSDAEAAKIIEATHKRVSQTYADEEKQIKLLSQSTEGAATSHNKLTESAVASSRAFFALTLASFGVMSVTQELKKSFGDDLPVAFEKTSSAIQQVASFGSAGAFIGGVPGAILGGIAGGLIAVTTAAISLDPALQQLNSSLDNMTKQDELITTLSDISGQSEKVVAIWLEAAKQDPSFAQTLEDAAKAAEPVPGIIASINETIRGMNGNVDALGRTFEEVGEKVNKTLLDWLAGWNGLGKFIETLAQGGSVEEALTAGRERATEVIQNVTKATEGSAISQETANELTKEAKRVLDEQSKAAEKAAAAQEKFAQAIEDSNFRLSQLNERTANQYAAALQTFNNAAEDAAQQRYNAISNAEQNLTNRVADLWQDLQNRIADINQTLADKIADIQIGLANKIGDIQTQLAFRIEDIQTDLADKLGDIDQDLANKLEDLAHKRKTDIQKANQDIEDAAKDLSRKLYEIERERLESIEALAFNTHEQLADARTSHDRDRIIRRAQFEQAQIDQQANDAIRDAQADYADKVAQAQLAIQLAQNTYDYEVALAKKLAEQKRQEAIETANIQIAQAQRNAQFQIEQAQRQAAIQMAQAEREAAQQLALAQRRHEQELASAQRTYEQQVEAARRAEQQRLADAQRALEQRNAAIAQSYELERQQIEYTRQKALQAYLDQIAMIGGLIAYVNTLLSQYGAAGNVTANLFQDWIGGLGDLIKPPTPDTSSIMGPPSTPTNELVRPPSVNNNSRSNNINIQINDATDPIKVGNEVRRVLQDAMGGLG